MRAILGAHGPVLKGPTMNDLISNLQQLTGISWIGKAVTGVVLFAVTAGVAHVATRGLRRFLNRDDNPLPSASIIVNIVRALIWIVGISTILDSCLGIKMDTLLAALGVGGIAVSLGFQDTLSNLIGGIQVTFMGIVKPGDNIEVGTESGVVQDVTWRHTTIRDALGQTVVIPNSIISTTALVHLLPANRVVVPFAIPRYRDDALERDDSTAAIDALSEQLIASSRAAAEEVSPVVDGPLVRFSEITELGIKGKVIMAVEDVTKTAAAADSIVRAIARELG